MMVSCMKYDNTFLTSMKIFREFPILCTFKRRRNALEDRYIMNCSSDINCLFIFIDFISNLSLLSKYAIDHQTDAAKEQN